MKASVDTSTSQICQFLREPRMPKDLFLAVAWYLDCVDAIWDREDLGSRHQKFELHPQKTSLLWTLKSLLAWAEVEESENVYISLTIPRGEAEQVRKEIDRFLQVECPNCCSLTIKAGPW